MSSGAPGRAGSRTARPGASGYEAGVCRAGCRASGRESHCGTSDAPLSSRAGRRRSRLPRRPPSATAGRLRPRSAGNRHHRPSAAIRSVAVSRRSSDLLMVRVEASQLHPRPLVRWPPRLTPSRAPNFHHLHRRYRKTKIPPLQCLVVNQTTGLPGEGIGWFMRDWGDFASFSRDEQRRIVAGAHSQVCAFPRWREVLKAVGLNPSKPNFHAVVSEATHRSGGRGEGESSRHRALKAYVAQHPECIGLPSTAGPGDNEVRLPSGDCLDVLFRRPNQWVAAEIKTAISNEADITRGLFQCVKYQAVIDAAHKAEQRLASSRAVLVLEAKLPQ